MKVTLLTNTPEPEKTVVLAAKLCYSPSSVSELEEKVKGLNYEKFLTKILDMGHLSVLEHSSFTFGVDGISRATSHQLVRHRLASYSQQSQRYVSFDKNNEYVIPPSIEENAGAKARFTSMVDEIYALYGDLLNEGVAAEDARFLLPNAACTKIIITMNARELIHFFRVRCCERAQWEIRDMATRMLKLAQEKAPIIFSKSGPACVKNACSEGSMTCGKPGEIREKFLKL
ncbi:MAG: FAD-dependent thymidylate synthase [Thermodesulfobacteriota bacterium]